MGGNWIHFRVSSHRIGKSLTVHAGDLHRVRISRAEVYIDKCSVDSPRCVYSYQGVHAVPEHGSCRSRYGSPAPFVAQIISSPSIPTSKISILKHLQGAAANRAVPLSCKKAFPPFPSQRRVCPFQSLRRIPSSGSAPDSSPSSL